MIFRISIPGTFDSSTSYYRPVIGFIHFSVSRVIMADDSSIVIRPAPRRIRDHPRRASGARVLYVCIVVARRSAAAAAADKS